MATTYDALFFDFDGVLADTVEVKTKAFAQLFEPYGVTIRDRIVEHHRNHGGMTRVNKFQYYYKNYLQKPLQDEDLATLCDAFAKLVVEKVVAAPAIPGAEEFLRNYQGRSACFIISGTPDDEIHEIVRQRGWSGYFLEICGAPVTKQQHLAILLNRYSLQPKNSLFFGDAITDYEAANALRVPFVGILPDENAPLLKYVPDIMWFKDFNDLKLKNETDDQRKHLGQKVKNSI